MNRVRANSIPPSATKEQQYDDSALEVSGVAASVKLLLKLIQDHKEACEKAKNDSRKTLRVATMLTILDNVRDRIQKSQSFGNKRSEETTSGHSPGDEKHGGQPAEDEEKERLRSELTSSSAACKSLRVMCSSLGKEKEIMGAELSKKARQLSGMEELVNDLTVQNENLLFKVKEYASKHEEQKCGVGGGGGAAGEFQAAAALQERNKELSEQLLRSLEGYRAMKRRLKVAQEENVVMQAATDEMLVKVVGSLERVRSLKERLSSASEEEHPPVDVRQEIAALESMFECFKMAIIKRDKKRGECVERKGEIDACKPSILA